MEGIVEFAFGGAELNGNVPSFDGGECQNRIAGKKKGRRSSGEKKRMDLSRVP